MREVNFSSPTSNRASVGITTALYDRRALDCTSTLPLINSLNHLCYLTQSSARIREILTIDGGVERLISILKNGKAKDMMSTWKWNLALQCVFNIGVRGSDSRGSDNRGSENIRVRVVEADIVPVIATVLDNYIQVIEKHRAARQGDDDAQRSRERPARKHRHMDREARVQRSSRREAPPPIQLPTNDQRVWNGRGNAVLARHAMDTGHDIDPAQSEHASIIHSEPAQHHHHRRHLSLPGHIQAATEQRSPRTPTHTVGGLQPDPLNVGDANLLPPMTSTSQPDTPLSPQPPVDEPTAAPQTGSGSPSRAPRRPSIRHQHSTSGHSDDEPIVSAADEPMIEIQDDLLADVPEIDQLPRNNTLDAADVTGNAETGTFNIAHNVPRGVHDGIVNESTGTPVPPIHFSPATVVAPSPEEQVQVPFGRAAGENTVGRHTLLSVPRDEDVIMSLQLLAYVSKYSDLRSYFQQSHLVPKLKTSKVDLASIPRNMGSPKDGEAWKEEEITNDMEYCQPDDYNIFPLVEEFTVKHHSPDMKYWASVVLRNLCRKDRNRGYIRQCAYHKCGRWENFQKQFAKCRRCRQTKYCSKECQKSAWQKHRFWCTESTEQR